MKQTAVEWLVEELQEADYIPKDSLIMKYVIQQAKEMEKQQQDEFAIGFAEWFRVCKLKQRPYNFENIKELLETNFDNIKELLEIYKKEQKL